MHLLVSQATQSEQVEVNLLQLFTGTFCLNASTQLRKYYPYYEQKASL